MTTEEATKAVAWEFRADSPRVASPSGIRVPLLYLSPRPVIARPLPWDGARSGKCYDNVREMIRHHGGDFCYGWALTDFGPYRASGARKPPPLYRRWLNHVVWQDVVGRLWEVTPNAVIDDPSRTQFCATEFVPDARATFEHFSGTEWYTRPSQYMAQRPEGLPITELLTKAQHSAGEQRTALLQQALMSLRDAGFQPREWKVELVGSKTGSIWLIAE